MTVSAVAADSETQRAGLQVGDMILEINGKTAGQESSDDMAGLAAGDTITVKVRGRRGGDRELKWKAGSRERSPTNLKVWRTLARTAGASRSMVDG